MALVLPRAKKVVGTRPVVLIRPAQASQGSPKRATPGASAPAPAKRPRAEAVAPLRRPARAEEPAVEAAAEEAEGTEEVEEAEEAPAQPSAEQEKDAEEAEKGEEAEKAAASAPVSAEEEAPVQPPVASKVKRQQVALEGDARGLVDSLCDEGAMRRLLEAAGYDSEKLPLEQFTRSAAREGLTWLKAIEQELQKPSPLQLSLQRLSKSFFAAVPLRRAEGEVIDTVDKIRERLHMVEALADAEAVFSRLARLRAGGGAKKPDQDVEAIGASQEDGAGARKKPQTPFFHYYQDNREAIAAEMGPGVRAPEVSKRASEMWKAFPEERRAPYEQEYREAKEEYDREQNVLKAQRMLVAEERDPLVERQYRMLGCGLESLAQGTTAWKLIYEYVRSTQHSHPPGRTLRLSRAFAVDRPGDDARFARFSADPNRLLLWHAAPPSSWVALLSQGLRPVAQEAPQAGLPFGKGLYFSDLAGQAAGRCLRLGPGDRGCFPMLLAEVALGKCNELVQPPSDTRKIMKQDESVLGRGNVITEPTCARLLPDGCRVPLGPTRERLGPSTAFPCNEYTVYNGARVRMRYLVEVRYVEEAEAAALDAAMEGASASAPVAAPGRRRQRTKVSAPLAGAN